MIVVGLTGRAGAGKSEVANHLVTEHGFTKLSFAGPLKQMLRTLDPYLGAVMGSPIRLSDAKDYFDTEQEIKEHLPEYRRLLQVLGTDCIRAVDEGFWVRAALAQLTDRDGRYVFDDVRFPNEAKAVRMVSDMSRQTYPLQHRSMLWRVTRPNHDGNAGNHVSEQYTDTMEVDQELDNVNSIPYLQGQVDVYLAHLMDGGA